MDNQGLAYHIAHRLRGDRPFDEVLSHAQEGLLHAAERFDPARGCKFSTYAVPTIWGYVMKALYPDFIPKKRRRREINVRFSGSTDYDDPRSVTDPPDHRAERAGDRLFQEELWEAFRKSVDPKRFRVLYSRFAEGRDLAEIGREIGITRERVRQLEKSGLAILARRVPNLETILLDAISLDKIQH